MTTAITVAIVGSPVACAEGVKESWRELADWAAVQLRTRYGDQVLVTYYDLFDPACPPLPADCPFSCDPNSPETMCDNCRERRARPCRASINGHAAEASLPAQIMDTVRLYNTISAGEDALYAKAVGLAWREYCAAKEQAHG